MRKFLILVLLLGPGWAFDDETEIEIDQPPPPEIEKPKPPPPVKPEPVKEPPKPKLPLNQRINAAIDKGVEWLKQRQGKDGSYGSCRSESVYGSDVKRQQDFYLIGPTAFAVFTLRKCGVPRKDKAVDRAVKWLKKVCRTGWTPDRPRSGGNQFEGKGIYRYTSYESSAIIMMLAALNKKDLRRGQKPKPVEQSKDPTKPAKGFKKDEWAWMHERVRFLINNPNPRMPQVQIRQGGWRYWPPTKEPDQDLSATQFALLGLRAAVSAGYPVHMVQPKTWEWAAMGAASMQKPDGGFSYQRETPWTAGMTAAGIACLLICKEQMANLGQDPPEWMSEKAASGLEFLGKNLDFTENKHGPGDAGEGTGYHYYHLYGIERVGALSGKHEIGGKAWYPRGAEWLVGQQGSKGAWYDSTCMAPRDILGTCFALLFLKKATMPTVTVTGN